MGGGLRGDVGGFYWSWNSLGCIADDELSIERCSAGFSVLKPRSEDLVKLREGFVGQKAEGVRADGEDVVVDVGMRDLFEEERRRRRCIQLVEAQQGYIAQLRVADLGPLRDLFERGDHSGEFEPFPED